MDFWHQAADISSAAPCSPTPLLFRVKRAKRRPRPRGAAAQAINKYFIKLEDVMRVRPLTQHSGLCIFSRLRRSSGAERTTCSCHLEHFGTQRTAGEDTAQNASQYPITGRITAESLFNAKAPVRCSSRWATEGRAKASRGETSDVNIGRQFFSPLTVLLFRPDSVKGEQTQTQD